MAREDFSTFQEVARRTRDKSVVLFGAGSIAEKTLRKLRRPVAFIIDNNPNLWETTDHGYRVCKPEQLLGQRDVFVLICTTSFKDVAAQLSAMGLQGGADYLVSPVLNDLRVISELEEIEQDLLFTSGYPEQDSPQIGGGLYRMEVRGEEWSHTKVFSGTCYGIIKHKGGYVMVDDRMGLVRLDAELKIERAIELEKGIRAHGLAYSESHEEFYVAASYRDAVLIFDEDFRYKGSIRLSDKYRQLGVAMHHCNDVCVVENSLFVSMFSRSGNFRRDLFDGVVLEYDLESRSLIGVAMDGLWMPHNICYLDGSLTVLDSLRGNLLRYNAQPLGCFPGFTRGLDYDGSYFYVGQSRNRNYSKFLGVSLNISIDASIIVFDEATKVSRSLSLPCKLSEIHSVLLI